jgi:hypothetical protein
VLLCEADLQVGGHPRHRVDRDRDSFAAPEVAFLEQDMRHMAITAVDDEPFDVARSRRRSHERCRRDGRLPPRRERSRR